MNDQGLNNTIQTTTRRHLYDETDAPFVARTGLGLNILVISPEGDIYRPDWRETARIRNFSTGGGSVWEVSLDM